jgi:sodium/bile acid cotransporter 7
LLSYIKRNWFLIGLIAVCLATLMDESGTIPAGGNWLKAHRATDVIICLIFLLSGLILRREQIRAGLGDIGGTIAALCIIFVVSPLAAFLISLLFSDMGVKIGLFLVAIMPTTISSGVVMTGAAGGNIAHALLITIVANSMSIVTIPLSLAGLIDLGGGAAAVSIDRGRMIIQMGLLVLAPLLAGLFLRPRSKPLPLLLSKGIPIFNQSLILCIVWMGISEAKATVLHSGEEIILVVFLAFLFHAFLLLAGFCLVGVLHRGPGKRESLIFMGGQKTLPLSVMLQVTLFPQYGVALAFCVLHHFIHLMMDSYLVGMFRSARRRAITEPEGRAVAGEGMHLRRRQLSE